MKLCFNKFFFILIIFLSLSCGQGHSWIEELLLVDAYNQLNYSHPIGFPRGYGKNDHAKSQKFMNLYDSCPNIDRILEILGQNHDSSFSPG